MDRKFEDTQISINATMTLEIKEVRGSSTTYSPKDGYEEVSSDTKTHFHWKLCGIAAKLGPEIVSSDDFDPKRYILDYSAKEIKQAEKGKVLLKADEDILYGRVTAVMDKIRRAQIEIVGLVTQESVATE